MKRPKRPSQIALIFAGVIVSASHWAGAADHGPHFSLPRFWWRNWAVSPWIPLVGDADGDGRADLVAVGGEIEVERTSPLGKWARDRENRTPFRHDSVGSPLIRPTGWFGSTGRATSTARRSS